MGHLDRPKRAAVPQFKIPYVCLSPYDKGPFGSFPTRQGYDAARVLQGDFRRLSTKAEDISNDLPVVQSFLQAWLFFGLIHEVHDIVGLLFEESEFISTDVFTVTATG